MAKGTREMPRNSKTATQHAYKEKVPRGDARSKSASRAVPVQREILPNALRSNEGDYGNNLGQEATQETRPGEKQTQRCAQNEQLERLQVLEKGTSEYLLGIAPVKAVVVQSPYYPNIEFHLVPKHSPYRKEGVVEIDHSQLCRMLQLKSDGWNDGDIVYRTLGLPDVPF